ncbi:protein of unknown function [Blastococcus saxobsidens DD2]|uniref:Uncharacterized protein n=1 Tax=Blastococcus saxobsidens (strain DD2) TaxID=1146883 RepID=H6RRY2_BLASD|nr:protein of unknown function [Blastococcus saxobsidens DD2]
MCSLRGSVSQTLASSPPGSKSSRVQSWTSSRANTPETVVKTADQLPCGALYGFLQSSRGLTA